MSAAAAHKLSLIKGEDVAASPDLSDHGLGEDFCSSGSTDHIGCLEQNLCSVLDGLQVPLSPRRHRRHNGFVDELLHQTHSYKQRGLAEAMLTLLKI